MSNPQTPRLHWTESQQWQSQSGRILTAGELLKLYRRELLGCSLCCATFNVRANGESWKRIS